MLFGARISAENLPSFGIAAPRSQRISRTSQQPFPWAAFRGKKSAADLPGCSSPGKRRRTGAGRRQKKVLPKLSLPGAKRNIRNRPRPSGMQLSEVRKSKGDRIIPSGLPPSGGHKMSRDLPLLQSCRHPEPENQQNIARALPDCRFSAPENKQKKHTASHSGLPLSGARESAATRTGPSGLPLSGRRKSAGRHTSPSGLQLFGNRISAEHRNTLRECRPPGPGKQNTIPAFFRDCRSPKPGSQQNTQSFARRFLHATWVYFAIAVVQT